MSNPYFTPSSVPGTSAALSSATIRAEFAAIAAGFDKLPVLSGNGSKAVVVNAGGTALGVTSGTLTLGGNVNIGAAFTTSGGHAITFTTTGATGVTLPTTGTIATLAGAEALTNKSVNGLTISSSTGTLTIGNGKTFNCTGTLTLAGTDGKTLTVSNSLTLSGTDGTTVTFPASSASMAALNLEDQVLTGGVVVTSKDLGTVSSGSVTPDPGDRPQQHYINGGAHTLAPSANVGSILVDITNNGSAGAITTSGFTKVAGDSFTTTNGHKFRCHISVGNGGSLLSVQVLQ